MESSANNWSGTEDKYNVNYASLDQEVKNQLKTTGTLGSGGFGLVKVVRIRHISMAKKSIRETAWLSFEEIQKKVDAIRSIYRHTHIIWLLGTYVVDHHDEKFLHLLTFPVADCDLEKFLHLFESWPVLTNDWVTARPPKPSSVEALKLLTEASGCHNKPYILAEDLEHDRHFSLADQVNRRLRFIYAAKAISNFLGGTMSCITEAMVHMHKAKLYHGDLKPENILLRNGHIFITDFVTSRSRSRLASSIYSVLGSSHGYCASEKWDMKHVPALADVYSLGCIFMHFMTVMNSTVTDKWETRRECLEVLRSAQRSRGELIRQYLLDFRRTAILRDCPPSQLVDLIRDMLNDDF